jgi:uncharacterized membrane protein
MATTLLTVAAKSVTDHGSTARRVIDALPDARTNVSSAERWVSLAAGGTLAYVGLCGREFHPLALVAGGFLMYRAATGNCPLYQAIGMSTSDSTAPNSVIAAGHGTRVEAAVVVRKSPREAYHFWRDFENLPRFMTHLLDVDTTTDGRSRWVARGPLGLRVEWEAELVADRPGEVIAWRSLPGSDVDTAGSVHFREVSPTHGTEVRVVLKYDPPAGKVGTAFATLVGHSPAAQIRADLRRFQQMIETGEVATSGRVV